jgi:hypothetical protein
MAWLLACAACAQPPDPGPAPAPPKPTAQPIDHEPSWPTDPVDEAALAALPAEAREHVARSTLPVLVVAKAELLPATVLVVEERWYAQSARLDGLTVSLHASRTAHKYPGHAPAKGNATVRGRDAFVLENEGIWSATWIEGGVAYAVDVECFARDDARCSQAYVLELAESVRFVGGKRP